VGKAIRIRRASRARVVKTLKFFESSPSSQKNIIARDASPGNGNDSRAAAAAAASKHK